MQPVEDCFVNLNLGVVILSHGHDEQVERSYRVVLEQVGSLIETSSQRPAEQDRETFSVLARSQALDIAQHYVYPI